jgi:hypothetical protein
MRTLVAIAIVLCANSLPEAALAQQFVGEPCGNTPTGGVIYCTLGKDGAVVRTVYDAPTPGAKSVARPVVSTTKYVPYDRLVTQPDGGFCVTTGYHEEGVTPTDSLDDAPGAHVGGNGFNNFFDIPRCPAQPRPPGVPVATETAAMVAARVWAEIPLPSPDPKIAPGRAITGKPAFLETRGYISHTHRRDTLFGPLEIQAVGTYTVDWGDGTRTGPHSIEGKAWPNGQISHEYLIAGTYNVVVTENWTANWRLDGESGVLRTLQTTGRINNFPVEQIQAVIGR